MSRRVDLAIGIAIVLGGILWIYGATQIHHTIEVDAIGEAGVPIALGVLFILGGLYVSVRAAVQRHLVPVRAKSDGEAGHPESDVRPLLIWATALVWALTVDLVGFLIVTPLVTAVLLWLLEYHSLPRLTVISIGVTLGLFLLLDVGLRVNLPAGPLAPVIDPIHL